MHEIIIWRSRLAIVESQSTLQLVDGTSKLQHSGVRFTALELPGINNLSVWQRYAWFSSRQNLLQEKS